MRIIETYCPYCNKSFQQPFSTPVRYPPLDDRALFRPNWYVVTLDDLVKNLNDAERRIEELENKLASLTDRANDVMAENLRLQEANRWIPVEERLPKIGSENLVLTRYGNKEVFLFLGREAWEMRGVTNWRAIEPPEGGEG